MKVTMTAAAMMVAAGVYAADFVWTGGAGNGDWTDGGNYSGNVAPGADDIVFLNAGVQATLDAADSASCALVSSLRAILANVGSSGEAQLAITVPTGGALQIDCAISGATNDYSSTSWQNLRVVKFGGGDLYLCSVDRYRVRGNANYGVDYYSLWDIREGSLHFQTNLLSNTYSHSGGVDLAEGTVLYTAVGADTVLRSLTGSGNITNSSESACYRLRLDADANFAGRIDGLIDYNSRGTVYLTGTNSTMSGSFQIQYNQGRALSSNRAGVTFLKKLGCAGEPSSMGTGDTITFGNYGGILRYTGPGEFTDKNIKANYAPVGDKEYFHAIDGGTNGGLSFGGVWEPIRNGNYVFNLLGNGASPCSMSGPVKDGGGSVKAYFQFRKTGSGTWGFEYNEDSTHSGSFTVEEGTLAFDTVAEKGDGSAFGTAEHCQAPVATASYNSANDVSWAVALGGEASAKATLEYTGVTNSVTTTRPIMLTGTGAVRNNGTGFIKWDGLEVASGAATLVLGGSNVLDNTLSGMSEVGGSILSVVKEDAGTWRLGGAFSGDLEVKAGKLTFGMPHWNFYRWVIRATFNTTSAHSAERVVGLTSLGLFDRGGFDRVQGLTDITPSDYKSGGYSASYPYSNAESDVFAHDGELAVPAAGNFVLTKYSGAAKSMNSRIPDTLFAHNASNIGNMWSRSPAEPPIYSTQASWWAITMRPTAGEPITSWDYVTSKYNNDYQMISNCTLEASLDGHAWTQLDEVTCDVMPNGGTWTDGTAYDSSYETHLTGRPIPCGPGFGTNTVASVSVASGAELEVVDTAVLATSRLVVNASGMGMVKGLVLAENGVIDIVDAPRGAFDIGVDLSEMTLPAAYSFTLNGSSAMAGRSISIAADRRTIKVVAPGTQIFFR